MHPLQSNVNEEIEIKYLVHPIKFHQYLRSFIDKNVAPADAVLNLNQAYIAQSRGNTVRVREVKTESYEEFVLCIKRSGVGINEVETFVSKEFAMPFFDGTFNTTSVSKRRFCYEIETSKGNFVVEVDAFKGLLSGLMYAEVEVSSHDIKIPLGELPDFLIEKSNKNKDLFMSNHKLSLLSEKESRDLSYRFIQQFQSGED